MMAMEERLSRLEGAYEHLATKADLAQLEVRLVRWTIGIIVAVAGLTGTIAFTAARLMS